MSDITIFPKGAKLILRCNIDDIYDGIVEYSSNNPDNAHFILNDVWQFPRTKVRLNRLYFYKSNIDMLYYLPNENFPSDKPGVGITASEYEHWKCVSQNYVYIPILDKIYHNSIMEIKRYETIAVMGVGSEFGRFKISTLSILVISTRHRIYLFDMKLSSVRLFDMGLREILQSKTVLKIVHNSRQLADCLLNRQWNIKLMNVFDTQIGDYALSRQKHGQLTQMLKFSVCVDKHLNLPKEMFNKIDLTLHCKTIFMKRPLDELIKLYASIAVSYLIPLKEVLYAKMMENYNKRINCYSNIMKDEENVTSHIHLDQGDPNPLRRMDLLPGNKSSICYEQKI